MAKAKGQPLYSRLWGSGWLPTRYAGVKFRSGKDPVLYLSNPDGFDHDDRRGFLDDLGEMNRIRYEKMGDPEIETRIAQYEMAFRMQSSVPELTDLSSEPDSVFELYGEDSRKPGTYAANCLLARPVSRARRAVHPALPPRLGPSWRPAASHCGAGPDVDQASAALIQDLEQRGMLEDTLVVWGGEFGRTVYCRGR
ncbi:MAG: DUF1501 domain-containing protein [Bryobacterales bacterium]